MATITFQDRLKNAEKHLKEDRLESSIAEYKVALEQADDLDQRIDLHLVLGRLYQRSKRPAEAIHEFEAALELLHTEGSKERTEEATVHNNLAALFLSSDAEKAVQHYRKALEIWKSAVNEKGRDYRSHLANTQFALAETYVQIDAPLKAKSHYKEAIRLYENLPDLALYLARARYQLGLIYTDEFNLYDAQLQYSKALQSYESVSGEGDHSNTAIKAALHNNLAVTYNSMEEREKAVRSYTKSLELYRELASTHAEIFLPYVAATLNSLSIVHTEMHQSEKAIEFMQESIGLYYKLSDLHPNQYTHYLATALHNQGLLYFEQRNLDKAQHFFTEALALRRKLMLEALEQFGPDTCATALNLVELYQINLESTLDLSYQSRSLELLKEVRDLLESLDDDRLVLKNMRADCASHLNYFNNIDLEELTLQFVRTRSDLLREEMHGTIEPSEKLIFQQELTDLLDEKFRQFNGNEKLKKELALAYNDTAWLLLRMGRSGEARKQLEKGRDLDPGLNVLLCNLGHCDLLENRFDHALTFYTEFLSSEPENSLGLKKILSDDLGLLRKVGVKDGEISKIKKALSF